MIRPFVLYVAGPYRARTRLGVLINVWRARRWAQRLCDAGYYVLCPHSASAFMRGSDSFWLGCTLELMRRCDGVALLPDWGKSLGARREHGAAIEARMPVAGVEEWIRNPHNWYTHKPSSPAEPNREKSYLGAVAPFAIARNQGPGYSL